MRPNVRTPSFRRPLLLSCLALPLMGCPSEKSEAPPAPSSEVAPEPGVAAPVADPLSRSVGARAQEEALRRKAAEVVSEPLPGSGPVKSAFAMPNCEQVEAADLDGNGRDEILCWGASHLSFWSLGDGGLFEIYEQPGQEGTLPGVPNAMLVDDLDDDGKEEVVIGWGMSPRQTQVPVSVAITEIEGVSGAHRRETTVIYREASERPQVVGLGLLPRASGKSDILVAYYESKYFVMAHELARSGEAWTPRPLLRRRMGSNWALRSIDGKGGVSWLIGRPYGDGKLEPGDLILRQGAREQVIPTERGVRSVAFGDLNGDGVQELVFGDGWHFNYGEKAEGRLSMAYRGADGEWQSLLIENTKDQYEIAEIRTQDLNGDGVDEIVAAGNKEIRLWSWEGEGWGFTSTRLAEGTSFTLATLSTNEPATLVVAGSPIQLIPLKIP